MKRDRASALRELKRAGGRKEGTDRMRPERIVAAASEGSGVKGRGEAWREEAVTSRMKERTSDRRRGRRKLRLAILTTEVAGMAKERLLLREGCLQNFGSGVSGVLRFLMNRGGGQRSD